MAQSDEVVVSLRGLSHRFGRFEALREIDLTIRRGDVYGLLGLNGAGKTTTIRLIVGLLRSQRGQTELFGRPVPRERLSVCRRIGATIEGPAFYPYLSGRANLRLLHRLAGGPDAGTGPEEALEIVGLSEAASIRVAKYSMGMLQRLSIAQALLGEPELIILDEPTSNLDPKGIADVRELIVRLNTDSGTTLLLSSHQLSEVEGLCNRVAILNRGRMIAESSVEELFEDEGSEVVVELDRPEEARLSIQKLDWCGEVRAEGSTLCVRLSRGRRGELNSYLVGAGYIVTQFLERRPTLEDYFHRRVAEDDS